MCRNSRGCPAASSRLDVARRRDGRWTIVELGDGQGDGVNGISHRSRV
ncbi:ATP-grasp domain-containing protein [Paludisphaera rhizosphaerae]